MATKRMLVDAIHPEETRIVVTSGNKLEEFDFESASRRQLRGNIYLAKVTRVEPSLQAAFIEYGGNRHGFLAFNEIHPDYYQIPVADREALMREEEEDDEDDAADEPARPPPATPMTRRRTTAMTARTPATSSRRRTTTSRSSRSATTTRSRNAGAAPPPPPADAATTRSRK